MKTEIKNAVIKSLTDKLNEIADSVIKTLPDNSSKKEGDKATEGKSPEVIEMMKKIDELKTDIASFKKQVEEEKTETPAEEEKTETPAEEEKTEPETPAEEGTITKKQNEIKAGMIELVKSMGIDTNNLEIDFVVKEKKKGTVSDDNSFINKNKSDNEEISDDTELEKAISGLDAEGKKEALDLYFKSVIFSKH